MKKKGYRLRLNELEKEIVEKYREEHKALEKECEEKGVPMEAVKSYWYKSKHFSLNVNNTSDGPGELLKTVEELIKSQVKAIKLNKPATQKNSDKVLKVTITDAHVGLESNPNGSSLYGYIYNKEVYLDRIGLLIERVYSTVKSNNIQTVIIDDLGDGLDGWNNTTTRGGKVLPQNLSNIDQFKTYIEGKIKLVTAILACIQVQKVIVNNITRCNHSGDFGYIANYTIQQILNTQYTDIIEYNLIDKFLYHYEIGEHAFIITHGKDDKEMKFGLPLQLNEKACRFIRDYIDHFKIKAKYVHVEKGDLHQLAYQKTNKFDYRNFMSFAPPSTWVQHNYGDSYSGYSYQIIDKYTEDIAHTNVFF